MRASGKFGAGSLILTANATYDGITLINAGILQVGTGGTTGSIPASSNILDSGTFAINRTDPVTHNGSITGSGGITIDQTTFKPTSTVTATVAAG